MNKYIIAGDLVQAADYNPENETWTLRQKDMKELLKNAVPLPYLEKGICLYFITVFEYVEKDDHGWPRFGASRTWGFYTERDIAIRALHENWTDMREGVYDYAVVEGFDEGISHGHDSSASQWFKWDSLYEGYREIDRPEVVNGFGSWAFG